MMRSATVLVFGIAAVSLIAITAADFQCLCSYNLEQAVLSLPDTNSSVLGYMYEFDCNPLTTSGLTATGFVAVVYEKQVGYVKENSMLQSQTCTGEPSSNMILDTTTGPPVTSRDTTTTKETMRTTVITPTDKTMTTIQTTTAEPSTEPVPTSLPTTPALETTNVISTTMEATSPTSFTTGPLTTPIILTDSTPQTTLLSTNVKDSTTTSTSTESTTQSTPLSTYIKDSTTTSTTTMSTTTFATTSGTFVSIAPHDPWENAANVSGTPFQYVGVGYNTLNGNPEVSPDPGHLLDRQILQLTGDANVVREAEFQESTDCTPLSLNNLVYSGKALQEEMQQFVLLSDASDETWKNSEFRNNTVFQTNQAELNNENVYQDMLTTCRYGNVHYNKLNSSSGNLTVTRDFATDVCSLPLNLPGEEMKYWEFIDKWGTSVVVSADLGYRKLSRMVSPLTSFYQHVLSTDASLLTDGGAVAGFATSLTLDPMGYQTNPVSQNPHGESRVIYVGSTTDHVPIKLEVVPIYEILSLDYFKSVMDTLTAEGICSDTMYDNGLPRLAQNFNETLSQLSKGYSSLNTADTLQFPVTWPSGTYGLMKAAVGCPGGGVVWQSGWRHYDTNDLFPQNDFSPQIEHYLAGEFETNIRTDFCMKTTSTVSKYDTEWPTGEYCLLKKGDCPNGFGVGYIYWDDAGFINNNDHGGTLPNGTYDENTKVYYCCRDDGSPSAPISLPRDSPFILIRHGLTCQAVHGMSVRDVFVRWDDAAFFNDDERWGMVPYDDESDHNHKLHFCYYERASSVLVG